MLRRLNLVMTYPVKWSVFQVMRDYIQNFFDALGPEHFQDGFVHQYDNEVLTMSARVGFSREWLDYLGASTKRGEGHYAGRFGEGFKIASLCAYRDYGFSIRMESRDWAFSVTEAKGEIDGKAVSFLAYNVDERPDNDYTKLTISNVNQEAYSIFCLEIHQFYYPGNPTLGRLIAGGNDFAIHETAGDIGRIFAAYQVRGSVRIGLCFCLHSYIAEEDDRDRDSLSRRQTNDLIETLIKKLNAYEAYEILGYFRKYWNGRERANFRIQPVLEVLVDKIYRADDMRERFMKENPFLVAERSYAVSASEMRKRDHRIAQYWFSNWSKRTRYHIVDRCFTRLGYPDIESLCRENGGFAISRKPNRHEKKLITVLKGAAGHLLKGLILYRELPTVEIITNEDAPVGGTAYAVKLDQSVGRIEKNALGLRPCYRINKVELRKSLLESRDFGMAFATYAHELLHQFGGDCSIAFRCVLLELAARVMNNAVEMEVYRRKWEEAG